MKFKHKEKVTCILEGNYITDAKISINPDGRKFICQNQCEGLYAEDTLEYEYSWLLNDDFTDREVEKLRSIDHVKNIKEILNND